MVNVCVAPVHVRPLLVYEGVTISVEVNGVVPVFVAKNEGMFPVPLFANPIAELVFTQLKTVPDIALLKVIGLVLALPQMAMLLIGFIVGTGFTEMVNC